MMCFEQMSRSNYEKCNEFCEQLTLVTDIFAAIVQECPSSLRLDACSTMLFMSQLSLDTLKKFIEKF